MSEQIRVIVGVIAGEYDKPIYDMKETEEEYTKLSLIDKIVVINDMEKVARTLYYYLIVFYSDPIHSGPYFVEQYNKWLTENNRKPYKPNDISGAFATLTSHELLLQTHKNVFHLNPLYAYRGDRKARIKRIQELYEKAAWYRHANEQRKKLKESKQYENTNTIPGYIRQDTQANGGLVQDTDHAAFHGDQGTSIPDIQF